jgi:hypothetical protein
LSSVCDGWSVVVVVTPPVLVLTGTTVDLTLVMVLSPDVIVVVTDDVTLISPEVVGVDRV